MDKNKKAYSVRPDEELLYPGDKERTFFWTKRWGITNAQLNDAIIETGSINTRILRNHLAEKGLIFSFSFFLERILDRKKVEN
jgi:hypothetical protein